MDDMRQVYRKLTKEEIIDTIEKFFEVKITWTGNMSYCMREFEFKDDSWVTEVCESRTATDDEIARMYISMERGEPNADNYSYKGIFRRDGLLIFDNLFQFKKFILNLHPENTNRKIAY
jgi:hypothetical protein